MIFHVCVHSSLRTGPDLIRVPAVIGPMLIAGATRQQVADVIGVGVKTIYKYFPAK